MKKIPPGRWDLNNWDYGFVKRSRGEERFMVYLPEHPQADKKGCVFRSRAVWWMYNGEIPNGYVIHHKDRNTLNDELDNLEILTITDHVKVHHQQYKPKEFKCMGCGIIYVRPYHIYNERDKRGAKRNYCSTACYQKHNNKMTIIKVGELRKLARSGVAQVALAKRYNVSTSLVSAIVNELCWRNI